MMKLKKPHVKASKNRKELERKPLEYLRTIENKEW